MPMFPQREPGPRPNYTDYQTPDYGGQTAGIYARLPQWAQIAYQMDPDPMLRDVEPDYTPSQKWRSIFGAFAEFAGLMGGNPQLAGAGTKRIAEVEQERLAPLLQSYMSRASENAAELQRQETEMKRLEQAARLFPYVNPEAPGVQEGLDAFSRTGDPSGLWSALNPSLPYTREKEERTAREAIEKNRFEKNYELQKDQLGVSRGHLEVARQNAARERQKRPEWYDDPRNAPLAAERARILRPELRKELERPGLSDKERNEIAAKLADLDFDIEFAAAAEKQAGIAMVNETVAAAQQDWLEDPYSLPPSDPGNPQSPPLSPQVAAQQLRDMLLADLMQRLERNRVDLGETGQGSMFPAGTTGPPLSDVPRMSRPR